MQNPHNSSKSNLCMSRSASKLFFLIIFASVTAVLLSIPFARASKAKAPSVMHTVSLPYYSTRGGWDSVLTLNNATHSPLTAALTLHSLDGEALPLPDVSIGSDLHIALRVSDLLAKAQSGGRFRKGSIELRFNGSSMDLGAQLTVSNVKRRLSFDMEPPMAFKSSTLESLWWSPDSKTSGQVMLSNTTSGSLDLLMRVEWQGRVIPATYLIVSPPNCRFGNRRYHEKCPHKGEGN